MTIRSRWTEPIPRCSLQQWVFGSSQGPLDAETKMFVDTERPDEFFLTMADYRLLAKRVALGLLDAGLETGDRVLLFSGNHMYYPALFMGILMAGGVFTGANPSYVSRELAYQLRDSGAIFMVASTESLATALEAADMASLPHSQVFVLDTYEATTPGVPQTDSPRTPPLPTTITTTSSGGLRHWHALVAGNRARAETWDWQEPASPETTVCCLNYSSGTTGVPKGVKISHGAYVANGTGVASIAEGESEGEGRRQVGLCFLPMYHAYGQTYFVANLPHMGRPTYLMARFDFERMLQNIERFRITSLSVVPPIAVALAKHPLVRRYDLSSVVDIGCGAAPLAAETAVAVQQLWPAGALNLRQGWGMTEITCTCMTWMDSTDGTLAEVGELMPNCAARLAEVGSVPPRFITEAGRPGELWVTGPTLMLGYWRKPAATAATLYYDDDDDADADANGGTRWLRTGDIAHVSRYADGGTFTIVDRLKELIKVKGNQVAPAELEALLLERPDVVDAAVIGVAVDGEERPRAYLVRAPNTSTSGDDIARWISARVAPFKRLAGGVVFVDAIPKNPSGKILRKILRDQAAKEQVAKL